MQARAVSRAWIRVKRLVPWIHSYRLAAVVASSLFPLCFPESDVELARKLDLFWSGLRPVLDSGTAESKLHDVVQLTHTVPSHGEETEVSQNSS